MPLICSLVSLYDPVGVKRAILLDLSYLGNMIDSEVLGSQGTCLMRHVVHYHIFDGMRSLDSWALRGQEEIQLIVRVHYLCTLRFDKNAQKNPPCSLFEYETKESSFFDSAPLAAAHSA